MLFAFLLLVHLVPYDVQGKHFLVKTMDEIPEDEAGVETSTHKLPDWDPEGMCPPGIPKSTCLELREEMKCVEPEDPLCGCDETGFHEICA